MSLNIAFLGLFDNETWSQQQKPRGPKARGAFVNRLITSALEQRYHSFGIHTFQYKP